MLRVEIDLLGYTAHSGNHSHAHAHWRQASSFHHPDDLDRKPSKNISEIQLDSINSKEICLHSASTTLMLPHLQVDSLGGLAAAFEDLVLLIVVGVIGLLLLTCIVFFCHRRGCCGLYPREDNFAHVLDPDELALQRALEGGGIELSGIDASTTAATGAIARNGNALSASAHHSGHRTFGGKLKHAIKSRLDKLQRRARAQMYAPVGVNLSSGAVSPSVHSNAASPRLDLDNVEIDTSNVGEFFTDDDDDDGDEANEFETTSLSPSDDRSRSLHSVTHLPRRSPDAVMSRIAGRSEAELMQALRGEAEEMHLGVADVELNAHDLEQLEMLSASSAPPAAYTA